jgi:hypothetical protein
MDAVPTLVPTWDLKVSTEVDVAEVVVEAELVLEVLA